MYVSGTSDVGVDRNSVGFYLKLHLVKVIVVGYAKDSGEVPSREEVLAIFEHGDAHVGSGVIILSYISNR